ncbi:nitric oxide synthase [Eubacteriales bacterium OttesenSCG-928-N13]|nr:nitric oxide synthase [Eubacteriales bacterium OttesenSCG-928-N13]
MNIRVFYHSSTGNTKKVADAIASAVGVTAEAISEATVMKEPVDLLFIGDGIYFGKPNKNTVRFIQSLSPDTVKHVAVFATYGGQDKIGKDIADCVLSQKLHIVDSPFISAGQSWIFMNREHPNEADLKKAVGFAKSAISKAMT